MSRSLLVPLVLVAALIASACGSAEPNAASDRDADAVVPTSVTTPPPVQGPTPASTKPEVTVPDGPPPTTLQVTDITVGTGPEAAPGQVLTAHYVGVFWSTKEQFDASWDRGEPIQFPLGSGRVIPGWDQGLVGMRVGGRRELVIPPDLAYGPEGRPPLIGPNETLVFVVDLIAVS